MSEGILYRHVSVLRIFLIALLIKAIQVLVSTPNEKTEKYT